MREAARTSTAANSATSGGPDCRSAFARTSSGRPESGTTWRSVPSASSRRDGCRGHGP
ncbi:hypothetical protein ACFPRL_29260 [Pseudoclavibacter helvolus]